MKYSKWLEVKIIFVIEESGQEYAKDFPNFCVDYFMCYCDMCAWRVKNVSQKLKH